MNKTQQFQVGYNVGKILLRIYRALLSFASDVVDDIFGYFMIEQILFFALGYGYAAAQAPTNTNILGPFIIVAVLGWSVIKNLTSTILALPYSDEDDED